MRHLNFFSRLGLALAAGGTILFIASCGPVTGTTRKDYTSRQKEIAREMSQNMVYQYPLTAEYDPSELRVLAAQPKKNPSRLSFLIGRAAAEKDTSFRDLAASEDLRRSDGGVALSLLAYDYSVNGNPSSLDKLMSRLAKERPGSDSATIGALAVIDEWQRSPAAAKRFFRHTDGAGSIVKGQFWALREFYFPEHFQQYQQKEKEKAH